MTEHPIHSWDDYDFSDPIDHRIDVLIGIVNGQVEDPENAAEVTVEIEKLCHEVLKLKANMPDDVLELNDIINESRYSEAFFEGEEGGQFLTEALGPVLGQFDTWPDYLAIIVSSALEYVLKDTHPSVGVIMPKTKAESHTHPWEEVTPADLDRLWENDQTDSLRAVGTRDFVSFGGTWYWVKLKTLVKNTVVATAVEIGTNTETHIKIHDSVSLPVVRHESLGRYAISAENE